MVWIVWIVRMHPPEPFRPRPCPVRWGFVLLLLCGPGMPCLVRAQATGADALATVHAAVDAELNSARQDHSPWEYRDHDVQPDMDKVSHVIESPTGNLSRMVMLNGKPLTASETQAELNRLREYVNSPDEQARKRKDAAHDDVQARELLNMLPTAFLWTIAGENAEEISLRFRPNPDFAPNDMQARVLGTMAGEMVVARNGNRIRTLRGTLTEDVRIGFGILGKLNKGGVFDIERRQIAPGHWQITETHVHIVGHALLFKTIGTEDDDTKSDWKPSTAANLQAALEQISR